MWSFFRGCGRLVDSALLESNKNNGLDSIFEHHPCLLQPLWRGAFFYGFMFKSRKRLKHKTSCFAGGIQGLYQEKHLFVTI